MAHDHHFLSRLDRVSAEHVDLALSLYRDHALLRFVLQEVGLPEGAERAAISMDDPREGPFIVVTREGRFVTCLAKGMLVDDLPIILPRALAMAETDPPLFVHVSYDANDVLLFRIAEA